MANETEYYAIQGIPVKEGQPLPLRQECNVWAKDSETSIQVSLFIRALQKFYDIPYDQKLSYFQVAGIHGYPGNLVWDGAPAPSHEADQNHSLYCTHGQLTFPTWHRPYMLLFEQRIYELMLEAIEQDLVFVTPDEKAEWTGEALNWRLPYWDWALPKSDVGIPTLFTTETVQVRVPKAADGTLPPPEVKENPLYRYQLRVGTERTLTKMGDLPKPYTIDSVPIQDPTTGETVWSMPWAECSGTSRWGITSSSQDWAAGINNWQKTDDAIQAHIYEDPNNQVDNINSHPVSDLVYRLLAPGYFTSWRTFSTTAYSPDPPQTWPDYLSLEYIHNNLHGFIGGDSLDDGVGHMENVPVAAFDPIFYMHHCNIDRQLAIWQTLNESAWFKTSDRPKSSDKLPPFHHKDKTGQIAIYTSDDVRYWTNLGYQYDVLERKAGEDNDAYIARIKAYLDSYQNTGQLLMRAPENLLGPEKIKDNVYPDYLIDILYDRYALGGDPYTLHFFIGQVSDTEVTNKTTITARHPRYVGSVHTFSSRLNDGESNHCANCARQVEAGALSTAQIPLTMTLLRHAANDSITDINHIAPDAVEPYLRHNLTWKAVSVTGAVINMRYLPRTKIYVLSGTAKHYPEPEKMSEYLDYEPMSQATHGKPCGASHDDYRNPGDVVLQTQ